MRLSMVLIARDERDNVRPCFDSFWGHVDEVVLCDTGSEDGTVAEASGYAMGEGKLVVCRFEWCDDFAAARNFAHAQATGEVHISMDLDERLEGGHRLRALARRFEAEPRLSAVAAMRGVEGGELESVRPRIFQGAPRWTGPVDERPMVDGATWFTDAVTWRHTRVLVHPEYWDRALAWADAEPSSFQAETVARWANEGGDHEVGDGLYELGDDCCARALRLDLSPQDRSLILYHRAYARRGLSDVEAAAEFARRAIRVGTPVLDTPPYGMMRSNWAVGDSWVILAWLQFTLGRHQAALACAEQAKAIRSVPFHERDVRRFAAWLEWQMAGNVAGAGTSGTMRVRRPRPFSRRGRR